MAYNVDIRLVDAWDDHEIIDLYRAEGWWKDDADPARIRELICGSFFFENFTPNAIAP